MNVKPTPVDLSGVLLKLAWAERHIETFRQTIEAYQAREPRPLDVRTGRQQLDDGSERYAVRSLRAPEADRNERPTPDSTSTCLGGTCRDHDPTRGPDAVMASVWLRTRRTTTGATRYRVEFRAGGFEAPIRYGGSFKSKREAQIRRNWVAGELAALRMPNLALLDIEQPKAPTLAETAERWQASRVDIAEATRLQHRTALRKALPMLGSKRIDEIVAQDLADLVARLHNEGAKRESIRKVVNSVAMVLDFARISPNPARDKLTIRLPREEPEELIPPSAEHVAAVYHLLPSRHRLPLLFLDWSGARVAAIDLCTIDDYDEPRRRVRLRTKTTKTRRALWVELPDVLADALEASLGPREDRDPEAQLFARSGADALRTAIGKACRAAGVPLFSPHDLRHRRVSLLHLSGMPWVQIGQLVGQRDLAVTANTYTHVVVNGEVDYVNLLEIAHA
jgi:integrase